MTPFYFVIKAEPSPGSPHAQTVAGAFVHIWALADSIEAAQALAMAHIMDQRWIGQDVEFSTDCTPELLAGLDAAESAVYQKSLRHGVAAYFAAWPHEERDYTEISSMGSPSDGDSTNSH